DIGLVCRYKLPPWGIEVDIRIGNSSQLIYLVGKLLLVHPYVRLGFVQGREIVPDDGSLFQILRMELFRVQVVQKSDGNQADDQHRKEKCEVRSEERRVGKERRSRWSRR